MTDDIAVPAKWERLCGLLDDDPELRPTVHLAATEPDTYFRRHEDDLAARGVQSAADVDPWTTLIDGLDDAGALAYLDEQDSGGELADALRQLPRVIRADLDLDEVTDLEGDLLDAISRADGILVTQGLRLVYLEEEPGAWPLVVVPAAHVDEIVDLSAQLGGAARGFA